MGSAILYYYGGIFVTVYLRFVDYVLFCDVNSYLSLFGVLRGMCFVIVLYPENLHIYISE